VASCQSVSRRIIFQVIRIRRICQITNPTLKICLELWQAEAESSQGIRNMNIDIYGDFSCIRTSGAKGDGRATGWRQASVAIFRPAAWTAYRDVVLADKFYSDPISSVCLWPDAVQPSSLPPLLLRAIVEKAKGGRQ
jgi:hypothetical protein